MAFVLLCELQFSGILTGGGVGRLMAHWIAHGYPDMDVTGVNVDRFHPYQCTTGMCKYAFAPVIVCQCDRDVDGPT